jgi:hypothetical protein
VIHIVNMIPACLSGETNQDSEPNLAVNPEAPSDIVATAFTPAPLGGAYAPIYVSTDAGTTWALRVVVPENGPVGTSDITVGFATSGGMLYAGILSGKSAHLKILRTPSFASTTPMEELLDRAEEDQPWVVAGSLVVGASTSDHVFVGNNDFNLRPDTATVDLSSNAAGTPPPAGFAPHQIEHRATAGQDGPSVRIALHPGGTVYAAFERWVTASGANIDMDVVVTRDDDWGSGAPPFGALVDSADHAVGQRVATNRFVRFNDTMGQERLGADLSIAVDPGDSAKVWIAWCDRVGGVSGTDWTLHVRYSEDSGQSWHGDVRTITNAKNPSLAITSHKSVGLAYQQFTGSRWETKLEMTDDAWGTPATTVVLHSAPAGAPGATFLPYIGDYIRLLAVGDSFYGVFSGNNTPDPANFPNGVVYQRAVDWNTGTLLNIDQATPVAPSIDPFFFRWSPLFVRPPQGPIKPVEPHKATHPPPRPPHVPPIFR